MRWLKTFCLLILLIVSTLLLHAVNSRATESPSQPNQRSQAETAAQQHNAVASPPGTAIEQPTTVPTATSGTTNIYNEYKQSSPHGDFPTWLQAIASIGLAIFAFWQINFVKRTTTASENAAEAARDAVIATQQYVELTKDLAATTKQSVELARLSLSTERPYITVTPTLITPTLSGAKISFELRNDGNRPAIIKNIWAGIKWEQVPDCPSVDRRQTGVEARRIHDYVLAPGRTSKEYGLWYADGPPELRMLDNEELLEIIRGQREQSNRELHIFGFVTYRDPAEAEYVLEFCWKLAVFSALLVRFYLDIFADRHIPSASGENEN